MRKISILPLIAVAACCINCGTKISGNNTAVVVNKTTAPTNTTAPVNTAPANKPAPTNANDSSADKSAASNPDLDFTLINKTGYAIKNVYIGASGTGNWTKEDEVLNGRNFANGNSLEIKFNPKATAEKWDVKVEWADNSGSEEWLKLNLTEIEKVTLVYDKDKDETSAIVE